MVIVWLYLSIYRFININLLTSSTSGRRGEQVNIYETGLNSTGNSHQLCDYTECVLPGDTNKDGLVDMTDMVSIFLSQGLSGSFRPRLAMILTISTVQIGE